MAKITIACISEEIAQDKVMGNNIRLVKLIKYVSDNIRFEIYTIKNKEESIISGYKNAKTIPIESRIYNLVKQVFSRRNYIKKIFWYFINYYSTVDFLWAFKACHQIIRKKEEYDLVFLQIPSLLNIIYGWYIKRKTNLPIIFDLRDDLICYEERLFIPFLEKVMVKYADLIVCTTKASLTNLSDKYPKFKNKLKYIPNGVDLDEIITIQDDDQRNNFFDKNKVNIVYAGSLTPSRIRILEKILGLIEKSINDSEVDHNDFQIHFYPGCEHLINYSWISHHKGITDKTEYNRMLKEADVLLSANYNTPFSIPGKLYEFLAISPHVWHFDNSEVCNEVIDLFTSSKLYLKSDLLVFKNDFIELLAQKDQLKTEKKIKNKYTKEFIQKFSRFEIARKYGIILNEIKKKGVLKYV